MNDLGKRQQLTPDAIKTHDIYTKRESKHPFTQCNFRSFAANTERTHDQTRVLHGTSINGSWLFTIQSLLRLFMLSVYKARPKRAQSQPRAIIASLPRKIMKVDFTKCPASRGAPARPKRLPHKVTVDVTSATPAYACHVMRRTIPTPYVTKCHACHAKSMPPLPRKVCGPSE